MSAVPPATSNQASKGAREAAPGKGLRGLMPYLRRYTGGIVFGLLTVVLMGIVGNVLPLATGVMTDTLPGHLLPHRRSMRRDQGPSLLLRALDAHRRLPRHRIRHSQRSPEAPPDPRARILRA